MPTPLISVIVPNYNYARFLREAVDSALGQTYPNVEVIVVDDSSTDNSVSVLESYGDRIRWIQQANQGVSMARNRGIQESRGEFIATLDADDVWMPEKLERQMELMKGAHVGMVYCGLQYIDAAGQLLEKSVEGLSGQVLKELALLTAPGVPASGSSALIRRECFDKVGLFDLELSTSADWDMWRRISCHYEIEVVREPLVLYRQHDSAMHLRIDVFEHDMLHAFASMFADPAAAEVHPLRRRCYAKLYAQLSGSYFHVGRWGRSIQYGIKSGIAWPLRLGYLLAFPYRRWRRRASEEYGTAVARPRTKR